MSEPEAFAERLARVEALVRDVENLPDETVREKAREIVGAVLDLHGAALARILELAAAQGRELIDAAAADELVASVLVLHDLHPRDIEARVRAALDGVRTGLVLRGARAELVSADERAVRVRVVRETAGCGSEGPRLRALVEDALARAVPEVPALEVEVSAEASAFVPLEQLRHTEPPHA